MTLRTIATFRVFGEPKAQPRPRAFARKFGDKYSARVYDSGTAENWKSCIVMAADRFKPSAPIDGPIRLDIDFLFPRPGRLNRKRDSAERIRHVSKPDRDNLEKAALDCLTQSGWFVDDCQVCEGEPRKFYVAKGEAAGAEIRISVIEEEAAPVRVTSPSALFEGATLTGKLV